MARAHRLDEKPTVRNDVTTGSEGFVHLTTKVRNDPKADGHYPKLPETDYAHDQDTNPGTHSPGPFHGDDRVSQQWDPQVGEDHGNMVDAYMYPDGEHTEDAKKVRHTFDKANAVPVRVVETVTKTVRITHQVLTPILVPPGQAIRIVGKDVTRSGLWVQAAAAGCAFVQPDIGVSGVLAANISTIGFPIPTTNIKFETEDELWAYCGSDAVAPGIYVSAVAEYLRGTDTLTEYYDG